MGAGPGRVGPALWVVLAPAAARTASSVPLLNELGAGLRDPFVLGVSPQVSLPPSAVGGLRLGGLALPRKESRESQPRWGG